jgi:hypothetical protein
MFASSKSGRALYYVEQTILGNGTTNTGTASASTAVDGTRTGAKAFDGVTNDETACWHSNSSGLPQWLKYNFGVDNSQTVVGYWLMSRPNNDSYPTAWQFQGSNDDSNWTTLDTRSSITFTAPSDGNTSTQESKFNKYTVSNTTAYRYYRWNVTSSSGTYVIIGEAVLIGLVASPTPPPPTSATLIGNGVTNTGTASASSTLGDGRTAAKAFDGKTDDGTWCWHSNSDAPPHWLTYDFGSGVTKTITSYWLMRRPSSGENYTPTAWNFQGSNDNSSWTTLDTKSGITLPQWPVDGNTNTQESLFAKYTISNTTAYRYYRWYFTATTTSSYCVVGEAVLIGY